MFTPFDDIIAEAKNLILYFFNYWEYIFT